MFGNVTENILEIFENMFVWFMDSLITPFTGLRSLQTLIFGTDETFSTVWGTFKPEELSDAFSPLYYTMMGLAGVFLLALIVINGMRISSAGINPNSRSVLMEFLKDLLIVGIVLVNLPLLYDLLFAINMDIVSIFATAYDDQSIIRFESTVEKFQSALPGPAQTMGVIGTIAILLVILGLTLWANFYYLMRKITLIILMAIGPLMMVLWLLPQFKSVTAAWFRELVGSIFVQCIHAFVFWTVATIAAAESSFIASVILYMIFIPISESIRRLLTMGGDMQGGLNKAGSMLGMAALAGMYGSVKGAVKDQSVMGALREATHGARDSMKGKSGAGDEGGDDIKSTLGAKAGSDDGTSPKAEKMLRSGDITSRAGKAVLGMAGSLAGSPLGPVGAMAGAAGGAALGEKAGGLTGRLGAGVVQGVGNRVGKGLEAVREKNKETDTEGYAAAMADEETTNWASQNKDAVMSDLKERFPDASSGELESKYDALKAEKRAGYYKQAKLELAKAPEEAKKMGLAQNMASASADSVADQWAANNEESFNRSYDATESQRENESDEAFRSRRATAFQEKKLGMRNKVYDEALATMKADDLSAPIKKEGFGEKLAVRLNNIEGLGDGSGYADSVEAAVKGVPATPLLNKDGKVNVTYLSNAMANMKTDKLGQEFIADQVKQGVPQEAAMSDWVDNHQIPTYRQSLDQYNNTFKGAIPDKPLTEHMSKSYNLKQAAGNVGTFIAGASNIGFVEGIKDLGKGVQAGQVNFLSSVYGSDEGNMIGWGAKAVVPSVRFGAETAAGSFANRNGGVIEGQQALAGRIGYAGGLVGGLKGYQVSKNLTQKLTPLGSQVQEAISSPGEVLQMAQTTMDDHGNVQLAKGAVRQVITPTESYVEVMTKSGEKRIVSRKGAGHSGLKQGETVYQDLEMQDDMLVVSKAKNSGTTTYRMDSAGGRMPSNVAVEQNPNALLGQSKAKSPHQQITRQQMPVFSQSVDHGSFYVEDLNREGMQNVQVVVEKDRQFVTAQKEGVTYRVSPVYSGDSRLGNEQTINVPMNVRNNTISPSVKQGSAVAVESQLNGEAHDHYSTQSLSGMMPDKNFENLMPTKHTQRVNRSLNKRTDIDAVRRKQGLLG